MKKVYTTLIGLFLSIGLFSQIGGKVHFSADDLVVEPHGNEFVKLSYLSMGLLLFLFKVKDVFIDY